MNDSVKAAIEDIDGIKYVTTDICEDYQVVLDRAAPFEVVDELREVLPVGMNPVDFGATQEHTVAIGIRVKDNQ